MSKRSSVECDNESMVSMPTSSMHPACSHHMMLGFVAHQEQPGTHCAIIWSDSQSKDFMAVRVRLCSLQWSVGYSSPDHDGPTTKLFMLNDVTGSLTSCTITHQTLN